MLCVKGYSQKFYGPLGSLLVVSGLVGSALSGIYVDRTKKFEETMKVCFAGAGIAACSFCVAVQYHDVAVWVALSVGMFGLFGFAMYPIGLEIGVETTYPVAEATSSGIIIIAGQVQGVAYVLLTSALTGTPSSTDMRRQTCTAVPGADVDIKDWKWAAVAWNIIAVVIILVFIVGFWPRYKRLDYETQARVNARIEEAPVL